MDDELRMKLADLGRPEALAACIIGHFPDVEPPIPLLRIAHAVGIEDVIAQKTDGFEGVLVTNTAKSTGSIGYNKASSPQRSRFTIAHELGHFLMPLHGADAQCAKADMGALTQTGSKGAREAEANRFAAALLMPRELFLRDLRVLRAPALPHLVKLADDYEVSKEAVARRYAALADDPCAVIFSHKGIAGHIYKTADFPALSVRDGHPLPRQCVTAQAALERGRMSECSEVAADLWLTDARRLRGAVLYEQFLNQSEDRRMSMLTIEGELLDDDEPDEDEELEESWTPRFHK